MVDAEKFVARHLGVAEKDIAHMLQTIGFDDLDSFIDSLIPDVIRREKMTLPAAISESALLAELKKLADQNKVLRSLIGQGYYDTIVPSVIARNVLENPAWYTAYTPYQPEISQGRLEALFNFQTMIADLTALDIANASLLDEGTAAAEAMMLAKRQTKASANVFLVDAGVHPQTIDVLHTRASYQDIEVRVADCKQLAREGELPAAFALLVQYPDTYGGYQHLAQLVSAAREKQMVIIFATDLLALTLLKAPGELGADIAIGNSQRFGVPLSFGGPHAAFMACREQFKRSMPGRLVGISKDSRGKIAYRLALQTREQHIRREKATSNLCTAQALLAVMAVAYAQYHGAAGLTAIAARVNRLARTLAHSLKILNFNLRDELIFDTVTIDFKDCKTANQLIRDALASGINLRRVSGASVAIAFDERSDDDEMLKLLRLISDDATAVATPPDVDIAASYKRHSKFLTAGAFNDYHSETEMMRYLRRLADCDLALDRTMIPLGSCTMKLSAATIMSGVSLEGFNAIHPFAPSEQTLGYRRLLAELENMLSEITGYKAVSLQPNSGASGEYAGLLTIRSYQESIGQGHRDVCLIPSSAHGTNPASAIMAGMKVVVVACNERGDVDIDDLRQKIAKHREQLSAIMITYPSTHGVFEQDVVTICDAVHEAGGQVYLDGANLNAEVGLAAPGLFGSDVSHLNLHKTFAIPHGGGGPGVGPICVGEHLAPFLPAHSIVEQPQRNGRAVSSAPWGSALVCTITWAYIRLMGASGLTRASKIALLNANYIAARLGKEYPILYSDSRGLVAHECIVDIRAIKENCGISSEDVAKRLIDFGFHAPTMSFPVSGTLMIEPTESESLRELDRFCAAMLQIKKEIDNVAAGVWQLDDNPLVNAPHTLSDIIDAQWTHPYSREEAALLAMNGAKYFAPVNRIDNAYGDRNLICKHSDRQQENA